MPTKNLTKAGKPRKPKRPGAFRKSMKARANAQPPELPAPPRNGHRLPAKNSVGRPPALVPDDKTLSVIAGLGQIWCTTKECAAVLHVSEPTFLSFIHSHEAAFNAYDRGKQIGKISLRRVQLALAKRHPAMAIFLGKNMLGQKDRHHIDSRIVRWDLSKLNERQLDQLEQIMALVGMAEDEEEVRTIEHE